MIKLVAFDWDGTLISNLAAAVKADNKAMRAVSTKTQTIKQFQENFEIPIMKYWENLGLSKVFVKENFEKIENVFHPAYEAYTSKAPARKGAKYILKWLDQQNVSNIIYSNHYVPGIQKHLLRLKINNYIGKILARPHAGDDSQIYKKTKQRRLEIFVKENKFKPNEVISVGDTEEEIEIGKKLGYITVAITGGWNSKSRLVKHKPDFIINNFYELKNIILKINKNA